jgi:hypothetical protein
MVNTFVLSTNMRESFTLLDNKRLGKQRLEAKQIIELLSEYDRTGKLEGGFSKHPACKMWVGHTDALKAYFNLCVREWIRRGFKNTLELYDVNEDDYSSTPCEFDGTTTVFMSELNDAEYPLWISFPPLINSHRASLYRKDPVFYAHFRDGLDDYVDRGYLWPEKHPNMYENWSFDYLDPIGEGAPSHYRIAEDDVREWLKDKSRNPKTKRSITSTGKLYKDYESAARHYGLV